MIQEDEISLSELQSLLFALEEQQLITIAEHESLLALAGRVNTDKPFPP